MVNRSYKVIQKKQGWIQIYTQNDLSFLKTAKVISVYTKDMNTIAYLIDTYIVKSMDYSR